MENESKKRYFHYRILSFFKTKKGGLLDALNKIGNLSPKERKKYQPLSQMTNWALICEEIVDTEYDGIYYKRVINELLNRGISKSEIMDMRMFAWKTAGWFNFEMMAWDWCSLTEGDILIGLSDQLEKNVIDKTEYDSYVSYLNTYI